MITIDADTYFQIIMSKYSLLITTALLISSSALNAQLAREASPSKDLGSRAIDTLSNIFDKYVDDSRSKAEATSVSSQDRQNLEMQIHKQERGSRSSIDYFTRSRAPRGDFQKALVKYEQDIRPLLEQSLSLAAKDPKSQPLVDRAKKQLEFIQKTMRDYGFVASEKEPATFTTAAAEVMNPAVVAAESAPAIETAEHKSIRQALQAEAAKLEKSSAFFAARPALSSSFSKALEGASQRAAALLKRASKLGSDSLSLKLIADIKDYQASILARHAQANPAVAPTALAAAEKVALEAKRIDQVADVKAAQEASPAFTTAAEVVPSLDTMSSGITAIDTSPVLTTDPIAQPEVTFSTDAAPITVMPEVAAPSVHADAAAFVGSAELMPDFASADAAQPISTPSMSAVESGHSPASTAVTQDILAELQKSNMQIAALKTQVMQLDTAAKQAEERAESLQQKLAATKAEAEIVTQQKQALEGKVRDLGDKIETAAKVFRAITQE